MVGMMLFSEDAPSKHLFSPYMFDVHVVSLVYCFTFNLLIIFQMQETQRDASLDREPLADSVRSCEYPRWCFRSRA